MLRITGDGRRAALDIRLVMPFESVPHLSKVRACAERVARIYFSTVEKRSSQLVFCDTSTPKDGFNMYDELFGHLVSLGVRADEVAYIHAAKTERARSRLFEKVRKGEIRVLIGSTFKLGMGVNIQDRLIALHHLDLPWRPADMVQREGRILRYGNLNPKVDIYRYITEGSFDAYSWQLLETKQRFIADILAGTAPGRDGGDVDDTVLDYAEIKALALGEPMLKARVEARNELNRLVILRRKSIENRLRLESRLRQLPSLIREKTAELERCEADAKAAAVQKASNEGSLTSQEKKSAADARRATREKLAQAVYSNAMKREERTLMSYRGFMLVLPAHMETEYPYMLLIREGRYRVDLSDKESGVLIRIDNYIDKLYERAAGLRATLELLDKEAVEIREELAKTDDYDKQIEECSHRLGRIDRELGVNEDEFR